MKLIEKIKNWIKGKDNFIVLLWIIAISLAAIMLFSCAIPSAIPLIKEDVVPLVEPVEIDL